MSLARVLARVRSRRGRAYVLGILVVLIALVPLAHGSPPDPAWIAGIYDAGDFDEAVWTLIGADSLSPPARFAEKAPPLLVDVLTGVGVPTIVAVVSTTIRPRSPPRI
jgi:hypothetical protein